MRALGLSPEAEPLLHWELRTHVAAPAQSSTTAPEQRGRRVGSTALLLIGSFLAASPLGIAMIAASWYTPYRWSVIVSLIALTIIAAIVVPAYAPRVGLQAPGNGPAARGASGIDGMVLERILWGNETETSGQHAVRDERGAVPPSWTSIAGASTRSEEWRGLAVQEEA